MGLNPGSHSGHREFQSNSGAWSPTHRDSDESFGVRPASLFVSTPHVSLKKSRVGAFGPKPSPRPSSLLSHVCFRIPRHCLPCSPSEGRLSSFGYSHKRSLTASLQLFINIRGTRASRMRKFLPSRWLSLLLLHNPFPSSWLFLSQEQHQIPPPSPTSVFC